MVDCQAVLQRITQCYLGVEFVTLLCKKSSREFSRLEFKPRAMFSLPCLALTMVGCGVGGGG